MSAQEIGNCCPGRMQIGELADRAGVSHRTIHYYERLGLLAPAEREGGGYRYYDEVALKRLEKIAALKRLGLNLDEIGAVIELYFRDPCGLEGKRKLLEILEAQLKKTDRQINELTCFRTDLIDTIDQVRRHIAMAGDG